MFVLGQFIFALARILDIVLNIMGWLIFIRAVISWVNPDPYNFIVQFLYRTTEPILSRIRPLFKLYNFGIDISPVIAILVILFLRMWLIQVLKKIAFNLM